MSEIVSKTYAVDLEFNKEDLSDSFQQFMIKMKPALDAALQKICDDIDRDIVGLYYKGAYENKTASQLPASTVPTTKPCGS